MMKLNCGISRDVAEPKYGSRGASVNVELELDLSLTQDTKLLHEEIRRLFALAKSSVDEELGLTTQETDRKAANEDGGKRAVRRARTSSRRASGRRALWAEEAIKYLGLDRTGLKRPDMVLQRLIKKGALTPTKIGRRLVFKRSELDRLLAKGDGVRKRGRPRKS